MKIYCKLCDKVQLVIIDNCSDAKTNEPFQDIVCKECHLVIATGTDIQREWVGLKFEEVYEIYNSKYRYAVDLDIADFLMIYMAFEAKLRSKNNG